MAGWKLAPCLQQFWNEVDAIAPGRDRSSDGSIGDAAHQAGDSDHNPDDNGFVCAVDTDEDTRAPVTMWDIVNYLIGECRKPNNVGLDRGRANYFIYERTIWRADGGWQPEPYTGANPHDKHMHLSCEHDLTYVNDTRPWGLAERFGATMPTSDFVNAFKDPNVQAAYRTMHATTMNDETGIELYNKANDENPKEIKKLGTYITGGPGTATDRIELKIDKLAADVAALADALKQHAAGILEGQSRE